MATRSLVPTFITKTFEMLEVNFIYKFRINQYLI